MKVFVQTALLSASLAVPASSFAYAAEDSRDTIIVTGRKTSGGDFGEKSGIPIEQVPQGVQVLSAEDLLEQNVRSIGDALRSVPSANVGTPRTSAYQSFSLEIRGFLADQIRNGVRQRYYEDVDASATSNIERIEVLKGPSSVLFGQSAQGGIISIVTKRPERDFGANLWTTVGSFDQVLGGVDVTGPVSEAAGLYFRANGEIERSGTFVDFQDIDRENASFSLTWNASDAVTAYLVTEWAERRTQRNPGLPIVGTVISNGVAEIPRERFLGDPGRSDLEAFAPLVQAWADIKLGGNWTLTPRFSYSGFDTNFTQLRVRSVQADGVTVNRNGRFGKEDDNYTIAQLDLAGEVKTFGAAHHVLVGVEYDHEMATFLQENIASVPSINALAPVYGVVGPRPYTFAFRLKDEIEGVAFYAQDLIDITSRLSVVAAVRHSRFNQTFAFSDDPVIDAGDISEGKFDHTNFQLGGSYRFNDRWSFFGGYATGFDIESTAGGRTRDGRPFDPEESDQFEAGLRRSGERLRASASIFQIRRKNLLTADPIDPDFSIQTGEVRVRGAELEGTWTPIDDLSVQGGYAFLDSEITRSNNGDVGQDWVDTPKHQANLFLRYDVPRTPFQVQLGANYVGKRQFSNADVDIFNGLIANSVVLPDYVTIDLGAAATVWKVRFDLALRNLFDATYYTREFNDFSVFPGEPRQVSLRVSGAF
ncbi:MAG: TonB-dependent receptor [Hyphomonadaceae bacterium]|nr:TonB-dependent receptor [Hyphomonadaceae bacterium]MBY0421907.1 TonB-dependent receptor [Parvularculaceae bacterium]